MLFIATPLYANSVCSEYLHGMLQTVSLLGSKGMAVQYAFERGTYIAINREKLVRRFLKTDCQFMLFIDGDTAFQALDVIRLLSADVDVVSGFYRYRIGVKPGITNHCFRSANGRAIDVLDRNSETLQECGFLPTGMLLIRRSVFERLYEKHEYVFDQGFRDTAWFQALFKAGEREDVATNFEGEDVHFSKIWREMGGQLFVKAGVQVGHVGERVYWPEEGTG